MKQIFKKDKNYKALVFIDRDGTINKLIGYLTRENQLSILPTVEAGIRLLNKHQIATIVVTNQPQIAHNLVSIKNVKKINETLVSLLEKKSAYIDAVYFCPHHPQGTIKAYAKICQCRKPNTSLYKRALKDYGDPRVLGIIGDSTKDIKAGKKLDIPTVAVQTGFKGRDQFGKTDADFVCNTFLQSVKKLLNFL